jgi:hypothetical protein
VRDRRYDASRMVFSNSFAPDSALQIVDPEVVAMSRSDVSVEIEVEEPSRTLRGPGRYWLGAAAK